MSIQVKLTRFVFQSCDSKKEKNLLNCYVGAVPWVVSRILKLEYSHRQNRKLKNNLKEMT